MENPFTSAGWRLYARILVQYSTRAVSRSHCATRHRNVLGGKATSGATFVGSSDILDSSDSLDSSNSLDSYVLAGESVKGGL